MTRPRMAPAPEADARFGAARVIGGAEWSSARFGWLESVRRDHALSDAAVALAHVLALDYANRQTAECTPSIRGIMTVRGWSKSKAKRIVSELVDAGWIVTLAGRGRDNCTAYGFVTRAKIVPLKGSKSDPFKGSKSDPFKGFTDDPFYGVEKGPNLNGKGSKFETSHNIAKPCLNHRGADTEKTAPEILVFWASQILAKSFIPSSAVSPEQARAMIEFGLLTEADLKAAGVAF